MTRHDKNLISKKRGLRGYVFIRLIAFFCSGLHSRFVEHNKYLALGTGADAVKRVITFTLEPKFT